MSFFQIIESLLIGPLKLLFEIIFEVANKFVGHPGVAIIFLSLVMNILVLPLYRRADAMQEAARDIDAKLHDGVAHIKKVFSGDEKMMILQTYYRQNDYKPTDALHGSVSLLLEIPFFIAAYQFLSHLEILHGVSLGPITDLGRPDGLLVIGGVAINLLPILMTLINFISSALYLKGFPLKTKIQLYGMAVFFLIFLYTSPAGLVFYWTLNNVFSLVKTIFYKLKNPRRVLNILTAAVGVALLVFTVFFYKNPSVQRKEFLIAIGAALLLPTLVPLVRSRIMTDARHSAKRSSPQPNKKVFITGSVFLTVLTGLLIPSNFIAASPQEYVDVTYFHNPLWYIVASLCIAAGAFMIWMRVFYWLASPSGKAAFDKIVWVLCGVMFVDYMFFGTKLGVISSSLQYENGMAFTVAEYLLNIVALASVAIILYVFIKKLHRVVFPVLLAAVIAFTAMSAVNVVTIKSSVDSVSAEQDAVEPTFQISKTGKNVVVMMLDRAIGPYVPYIFNEKPELKEKFDGFTYYSNVISFGGHTNFGVPALLGGYEYTPVEMNKRSSEALVDKHNEALKMMPVLFQKNGYDVTVCDPTYANYEWVPDLSLFKSIGIDSYITNGHFSDPAAKERTVQNRRRNFFCFSIMKSMPLFLQPAIYSDGTYNQSAISGGTMAYSQQAAKSLTRAEGINQYFMDGYNVLTNLPNITKVTKDKVNTYLYLASDATHNPTMLQTPDYVPAENVDNMAYDTEHEGRFTVDGKTMAVTSAEHIQHYHANMGVLLQLGAWFDYLRDEGVYDNTRIILVSDHGQDLGQFEDMLFDAGTDKQEDVQKFFPLLMVKDFDSTGFVTSDEFMTNADVPSIAVKDIIDNPQNPFTGKEINSSEKTAHDQYVILSTKWGTDENNGNAFLPSRWAKVSKNIHDRENWAFYDKEVVLSENAFPSSGAGE